MMRPPAVTQSMQTVISAIGFAAWMRVSQNGTLFSTKANFRQFIFFAGSSIGTFHRFNYT